MDCLETLDISFQINEIYSSIALLGISPRKLKSDCQGDTGTLTLTDALFIVDKKWKLSEAPSNGEWIKLWQYT